MTAVARLAFYLPNTRVVVTSGPLAGQGGTVIKDELYGPSSACIPFDRVWVLLDAGDNPQRYLHNQLSPLPEEEAA